MFEKAVAFTSVGTDWAIAYKQKTGQLWMGPTYSPLHPQCKCCTTERPSGSVLWTEPSASTPYPEPCFLSASSYSTSFTGSPTKCCDTRTSTPACNRSISPGYATCSSYCFFSFLISLHLNQNRLSYSH